MLDGSAVAVVGPVQFVIVIVEYIIAPRSNVRRERKLGGIVR